MTLVYRLFSTIGLISFIISFSACTNRKLAKKSSLGISATQEDQNLQNDSLNDILTYSPPTPTPTATPSFSYSQTTYSNNAMSAQATTITPVVLPPVLKTFPDFIYPQHALIPGVPFTVDFNNIQKSEPGDDFGMTYSCLIYSALAPLDPYPCAQADGAQFDSASGILSVTPPSISVGTYKVKVTGSNSAGSAVSQFTVSVRAPYSQAGLLVDLDSRFALLTSPALSGQLWTNLIDPLRSGTLYGSAIWAGSKQAQDPFRLELNKGGSNGMVRLGNLASSKSRIAFTLLASSASPTTLGSVIAGTMYSLKGWLLRQSISQPGKVELAAGQTYQDLVLSHKPVGYWRLNEQNGTVAKDLSGNNNNADIFATAGSFQLGSTGPVQNDASSKSLSMKNYSRVIAQQSESLDTRSTITISVWFKPDGVNGYQPLVEYGKNAIGAIGVHVWQYGDQQTAYVNFRDTNRGDHVFYANKNYYPILINQWNHLVAVYDGNTGYIYLNGKKAAVQTLGSFNLHTSENLQIGMREGGYGCWGWCWQVHNPYQGEISEVSIFKKPLNENEALALYDTGKGKYGSLCLSKKNISSNAFTALGGIVDPSNSDSGLKLYLDGEEQCSTAMAMESSQLVIVSDLVLGNSVTGSAPFSGAISDFKLYSNDLMAKDGSQDLFLLHSLYKLRNN